MATRRQGLVTLVKSGALHAEVFLQTPWLSLQDMCYLNALPLKVHFNGAPFFEICSGTRIREGIRTFLDECAKAGKSEKSAHYLYVNGLDSEGLNVPVQIHLQRGASLSRLTDMWLSTWGEEEMND